MSKNAVLINLNAVEDIMPMVKSFGYKDLFKKAVATHGWNPLNCGLLLNQELRRHKHLSLELQILLSSRI